MDGRSELQTITREEIAGTLGQDPEHVLMGLFETHLRELGERVDGSFLAFAQGFDGSAEALATELSTWPTWSDVSPVPERRRAAVQARPDRRRRPRAGRHRPRGRPRTA